MKKYKLKANYPGCDIQVGEIVQYHSNSGFYCCYEQDFPRHNVENYPEFWELVEDKVYEILEVQTNFKYVLNDEGNYIGGHIPYRYSLEELQRCDNFKITKVRRNSDSEIFNVGDNAKLNIWSGTNTIITDFRIKDDKLEFHITQNKNSSWYSQLDMLQKYEIPKVMFVTLDGVTVTKGTIGWYYVVESDYSKVYESYINPAVTDSYYVDKLMFASRDAAHIYMNKKNEEKLLASKLLSYNDVHKILVDRGFNYSSIINPLKELVKSR